jgi:hypothetical protein
MTTASKGSVVPLSISSANISRAETKAGVGLRQTRQVLALIIFDEQIAGAEVEVKYRHQRPPFTYKEEE